MKPPSSPELGRLVVSFFQEYLPTQRGMSPHTLRSYRDAIVLWLQFAARDCGRPLESLRVADLTVGCIERFLLYLEAERHNGIATRNARLAALHTFARHIGAKLPEQLGTVQSILNIPFKRGAKQMPIEYPRAATSARSSSTSIGARRRVSAITPSLLSCAIPERASRRSSAFAARLAAGPTRAGAPARQGREGPPLSLVAADREPSARAPPSATAR